VVGGRWEVGREEEGDGRCEVEGERWGGRRREMGPRVEVKYLDVDRHRRPRAQALHVWQGCAGWGCNRHNGGDGNGSDVVAP
jgi:hypothetical protein